MNLFHKEFVGWKREAVGAEGPVRARKPLVRCRHINADKHYGVKKSKRGKSQTCAGAGAERLGSHRRTLLLLIINVRNVVLQHFLTFVLCSITTLLITP